MSSTRLSPIGLRIAAILLLSEGGVMLLLSHLTPLSTPLAVVADALVLSLLATPFIILTTIRPYVQARNRAERELARSARQFSLLLDSTWDGLFSVDTDGRTTYINPAAARMVGWAPEELIGRHQHDLFHHTRRDGSAFPAEQCPICASYRDGLGHEVDDEVFIRRDGTRFAVEYLSNPIIDDSGQVQGAVVSFRDIDARHRADRAQQRNMAELERINRLAVGRELRMLELKREVNALHAELGRAPKYRVDPPPSDPA